MHPSFNRLPAARRLTGCQRRQPKRNIKSATSSFGILREFIFDPVRRFRLSPSAAAAPLENSPILRRSQAGRATYFEGCLCGAFVGGAAAADGVWLKSLTVRQYELVGRPCFALDNLSARRFQPDSSGSRLNDVTTSYTNLSANCAGQPGAVQLGSAENPPVRMGERAAGLFVSYYSNDRGFYE